jgi:hypothetical protein
VTVTFKSPRCPGKGCGIEASVCGPERPWLVCGACGLLWDGTPEQYAQAERADAAYAEQIAREEAEQREAEQRERDRAQAIALFEAAGMPLPAWLREERS